MALLCGVVCALLILSWKVAKAMLIKESVLRPEIFQILSASQAKNTQKKTVMHIYI